MTPHSKPLQAFKLGIDNIPDWFMDKVSTNEIILRGEYRKPLRGAEIKTANGVIFAERGDFVIRSADGEIGVCKSDARSVFNLALKMARPSC